ncbi:MAG: hypothetical protein QME58_05975 [Bacteroidota bacterium]|nr:hypothetical protein [Bacteroidota bacterium]
MVKLTPKTNNSPVPINFSIQENKVRILLILISAAAIAMLVLILSGSYKQNGFFGFTLDDPWIHLQFAKNLNEYGSFSYYKNELSTAGSTAPLYTILLSVGFFFTKNEFLLSYFFGIIFSVASFITFFFLLRKEFDNSILIAIAGSLMLFLEPRLVWISLSGMETTFAIFLIILTLYFYKSNRGVPLGICFGLFLWTRPEALILIIAIIFDILYNKFWIKADKIKKNKPILEGDKWLQKSAIIFSAIAVLYLVLNLYLSGTIFPNTFTAKIKYYSGGGQNYFQQLLEFLTSKHLFPFAVFVGIGLITVLLNIALRRKDKFIVYILWSIGLSVAFAIYLPFLYQNGRYLMPVLPFVIVIGLQGVVVTINLLYSRVFLFKNKKRLFLPVAALLLIFLTQFGISTAEIYKQYALDCKYINDRQVTTAKWLKNNLPQAAVVATHDVGAIAFYSDRKIVDMVGLISPEMIQNIGSFDGLKNFIDSKNSTHLAVLRNWFHLGNQTPIYQTDERFPEVMEVFKYDPRYAMFVSQNIVRMNEEAEYLLNSGKTQQAGYLLEQSIRMFPNLDWSHYLMGKAFLSINNLEKATKSFQNALNLNPEHNQANRSMDFISSQINK